MTQTRRTASILSIALALALGTGTAAHAQRADKAMVTDIVPEAIGEVSYSDWLYYGVVDSIGGAISWIGGIAGSSSEVVTGSPMDWVESVDATETLSFWQLLNDAGYKLKEIDTHVALIPDVELKFAYVRELSEADRVYLERKLDRAEQLYSGPVKRLQRLIVHSILEVNESDKYFLETVKIKMLPLPAASFSVAPVTRALPEDLDMIYRAVIGRERKRFKTVED
jgi:hypothetical protein